MRTGVQGGSRLVKVLHLKIENAHKKKTFEDAGFALNLATYTLVWYITSRHQFHLCNLRVAQHQTLYWKGSQERKEGQVVDP